MLKKLLTISLSFLLLSQVALAADYYTTPEGCNHSFIDIIDHWSEESICFLYEQGVVEGHSDRNYLPDSEVTRAEFLKISLLNLGYVTYAVQSAGFTDVNPGDWYYQYATFARSKGFVSGYNDGSFKPNNSITRAEAVVMIIDIADIINYDTSYTAANYSDVSNSDWYATAVSLATSLGIVEGYGDNSFRPDNPITRAEAAIIAQRIWDYLY